MRPDEVVEERSYKGWTLTISKRWRNFDRPYFAQLRAPDGKRRYVSRTQTTQAKSIAKEVTFSSIEAARHAGFTAVNHYEHLDKAKLTPLQICDEIGVDILNKFVMRN